VKPYEIGERRPDQLGLRPRRTRRTLVGVDRLSFQGSPQLQQQ
jgi:hypothetical protein